MTTTDWILDVGLIALVLLQVRGRTLSWKRLAIPVAVVIWACFNYLHGIPTAGNDLLLVVLGLLAGGLLGVGCGVFTHLSVGEPGGPVRSKAGPVAAALWVLGVGTRLAFQLYATHGGARAIVRFSATHHITSANAWVACLVLMALAEVVARLAVIVLRARPLGFLAGSSRQGSAEGPMMEAGDSTF